jgi:hypothetical protein
VDPGALKALARHGDAIATARAFAERAHAHRVVLLVDRGDGRDPVLVDCAATAEVEITEGDEVHVISGMAIVPADPRPLPAVRPAPSSAITIDTETGELAAPIGTIEHLADCVLALASAFGGRTVATAQFATRDPELPITIAAREGEPPVLAAGDQEFLLPRF